MKAKLNALVGFRILFCPLHHRFPFGPKTLFSNFRLFCTNPAITNAVACSSDETQMGELEKSDSAEVFRKWGCSESDISTIFRRHPSLRNARSALLQCKLAVLDQLGLPSSDLVKIINCRPRLLTYRINHEFDERLHYLQEFFGSREVLLNAIKRNPSLLTYDLTKKVKPVIERYSSIGVSRKDLIRMILSRPTVIPRTSLTDEKIDYIQRTGVPSKSKLYKYVVTIIAISRIQTIREKVANLEKFGFSDDEVLGLYGRAPIILTLSIDKVQRNMTFILGMMKLPAKAVLSHPYLLTFNLEAVLKPRFLIGRKIQDMALSPKIDGQTLFRALRMTEKRFLKAFVTCHSEDVSDELLAYYENVKCVKRLAETSKRSATLGFPF